MSGILQKKAMAGPLTRQMPARLTPVNVRKDIVLCRAQQVNALSPFERFSQRATTMGAAALLMLGSLAGPSIAGEFDILAEPTPTANYYIDDANVLSKATRGEINQKLKVLEIETGYRTTAVTVRKLEFEPDTYAFADKVLAAWYPNADKVAKKGLILVVTAAKEGAVTGGKAYMSAITEELADSITTDNIPIFTEQEKYNQCLGSVVDRVSAQFRGDAVPEAPRREDVQRMRTYKTKEEVEKSKTVTTTVVVTLLIIAVVVPMLQYYGYTARD